MSAILVMAAVACALGTGGGARAASSGTVVSLTIPSATEITPGTCRTGAGPQTDFGTVLPGANRVTSADCAVGFGSSNDSASLHVRQLDGVGVAMARPSTGALDTEQAGDGDHYATLGHEEFDLGASDDADAVDMQTRGLNAGKLIVGGGFGADRAVYVQRRLATGGIDPTFGSSGSYTWNPTGSNDVARDVLVLPDDKIIVVGHHNSTSDGFMLRLTAEGDLDTTFSAGDGSNGFHVFPPGTAEDAALLPDGRIAVVGDSANDGIVYMYRADGVLDTTWGATGQRIFSLGFTEHAEDLFVQQDGGLLLSGLGDNGTNDQTIVVRLTPAGAIDWTRVIDASGALRDDEARGIAQLPNGRIVVTGFAFDGTYREGYVLGLLATGADDLDFPVRRQNPTPGDDDLAKLVTYPDSSFVVVGTGTNAALASRILVQGFTSTGLPDGRFSTDGVELYDHGDSYSGEDMIAGADGKLVIVGRADANDTAVMRLESVRIPNFADPANDWTSATALFGACLSGVSGAASAVWTDAVDCTTMSDPDWRTVQAQVGTASRAATTASGTGTAHFRWGVRFASSQPAGQYVAPLSFEVVAPAT